MREKVIFSTNVPVTVTLAFQDGLLKGDDNVPLRGR